MSLHSPPKSPKSLQRQTTNLSNFYEQSLNAIRIRIDNIPPGKTWKQIRYLIGGIINHNYIIQVKVMPPFASLVPPFHTLQSCVVLLKSNLSSENLNNLLITINSYQWDLHDLFAYLIPNQAFPGTPMPSTYSTMPYPGIPIGTPMITSPSQQHFQNSTASMNNIQQQFVPISPLSLKTEQNPQNPIQPQQQQQQQSSPPPITSDHMQYPQQPSVQQPLLPALPLVPSMQPIIGSPNNDNTIRLSEGFTPMDDTNKIMYPMAYPTTPSFPQRRQLYHQPLMGNKYMSPQGHLMSSPIRDHEQDMYSLGMYHMTPRSSISSEHDNIAYLTSKKGLNPFKQPRNLKSIFNEKNFRKQMTERNMYQIKLKNFPPYLISDSLKPMKDNDGRIDIETNYLEKYGKLRWTVLKDFIKLKCPTLLTLQDSEDSDFSLDNTREFYVGVYEANDTELTVKIDNGIYQVDAVYFNAIIGFRDKELADLCLNALDDQEYALNYKLDVSKIERLEREEAELQKTPDDAIKEEKEQTV
ncbi:hypothetical protein C6P45_005323 [Maudiozyma exigua]|uniref:Uncharacterized protein n=1 Tax=Maudiozyma exigua TaxID=34358 RepID=A0A9P6WF34_MAUEX|nr:hypothetical protein C6P45_005323 [Kazachstania exigua]